MPPLISPRGAVFLFLLVPVTFLAAQNTLSLLAQGTLDSIAVSGRTGELGDGAAEFRADWIAVDEQGAEFHFLPVKGATGTTTLDQLIIAGVEQYLDQRIHFTRDGVQIDLPVVLMGAAIEKMIGLAGSRFGAPAISLSTATLEQLGRVSRIDWSQANFGVYGEDDQEKYMAIYYYVRAQRLELERQLRSDLVSLSDIRILSGEQGTKADAGKNEQVPTVCSTVFDEENFLCALDLRVDSTSAMPDVKLTDAMLSDIAAKAESARSLFPAPKLRKRDRWLKAELDAINRRIDQSDQRKELWALRDRMDDMEDRLDDIGMQVDDLRSGGAVSDNSENPLAELSRLTGKGLTVRFTKGSAELGREGTALLDEVIRTMGRAPKSRLLVTGYTDLSGDAALNLALSERRAKAVRAYMLDRGISGERVLLNYFGARRSTSVDATERRVELEWVQ